MTETITEEVGFQATPSGEARTELGTIKRYEVFFEGGWHSIYSPKDVNPVNFEKYAKKVIASKKLAMEDPSIARDLESKGTSLYDFTDQEPNKLIADIREWKLKLNLDKHVLNPFIVQIALERLYYDAVREQAVSYSA